MRVLFYFPAFEGLGIQILSAVLKQHGHTTECLFDPMLFDDRFVDSPRLARMFSYREDLINQAWRFQPDLICFSTLTDTYVHSLGVARDLRRALGGVPIAFGGIHVTSVPDRVIAEDCVDFVCIGEGEYPLLELVQHLEAGAREFPIQNIWYKRAGSVVKNPLRPLLQDLDQLPWPDKELFYRQAPYARTEYNIMALRGCVYQCSFCHHSLEKPLYQNLGPYIRRRSVGSVIAELKSSLEKYRWKTLKIWDQILTFDKVWLREFAERYRAEINRPFWCFAHPNYLDGEVIDLLKHAGCWQYNMGIQTFDRQVKHLLGRPESLETIRAVMRRSREAGIQVVVDQMLSLPGQDPGDLSTAVEFFMENRPDHINTYWLRYFPRTAVVGQARSMGLLSDADIDGLELGQSSFSFTQGGTMPRADMEALQTVLAFQPILPNWAVKYVYRRALRGRMLSIRLIGHILSRMVHWDLRRDVGGRRYLKHYLYFVAKRMGQGMTFRRRRVRMRPQGAD